MRKITSDVSYEALKHMMKGTFDRVMFLGDDNNSDALVYYWFCLYVYAKRP